MNKRGEPDADRTPQVSNDPQSLPEEGVHKHIISPDPEKEHMAQRHESERERDAIPREKSKGH